MNNEKTQKGKSGGSEKPDTKASDKTATSNETESTNSGKKTGVLGFKRGDIVDYHPSKEDNTVNGNTEEPAPAIIRKVYDEHTVDLTVFRDGPSTVKSGVKYKGTKLKGDTSSDAGYFTELE